MLIVTPVLTRGWQPNLVWSESCYLALAAEALILIVDALELMRE